MRIKEPYRSTSSGKNGSLDSKSRAVSRASRTENLEKKIKKANKNKNKFKLLKQTTDVYKDITYQQHQNFQTNFAEYFLHKKRSSKITGSDNNKNTEKGNTNSNA